MVNNNSIRLKCKNCGMFDHNEKKCSNPITSYGIICFNIKQSKKHYLLIQRRNSLYFTEFIRGKMNNKKNDKNKFDINYIKLMIENMSQKEHELLETLTFDELWKYLWRKTRDTKFSNDYKYSKAKFNKIKEGIMYNNELITLDKLLKETKSKYIGPEWGFPKGRRGNINEEDLQCAKREFIEESGLLSNQIEILDYIAPICEQYESSNGNLYKSVYYIAQCNINMELKIRNEKQAHEVQDIGWFSKEECMNLIRPYHIAKKNVLEIVDNILHK
jgi:8-oxo-dGTP pyrophosphatase MutT (NUDIX family)